jgi:ribosomal protein S18 acetylase RimI-like enzyme
MVHVQLIQHAPGAPGLRWLGVGPGLRPSRGLLKLKRLLDKHAFWAKGRSHADLRRLLAGSQAVVSLWRGKRMVGFGRATSDGLCRAVLWDVVVAGDLQGRGLGRQVVQALLTAPALRGVERVYLMTTNSAGFYRQLGFRSADPQELLVISCSAHGPATQCHLNPATQPSGCPSQAPEGHSSSPGCS